LKEEKAALLEKYNEVKAQKSRLDKIVKQTAAKLNKSNPNELVDELGLIQRRLELLEASSEEREREMRKESEPYRKEIDRLMNEIEAERVEHARIITKKNAEISYFKQELDLLLNDMKSTYMRGKGVRT